MIFCEGQEELYKQISLLFRFYFILVRGKVETSVSIIMFITSYFSNLTVTHHIYYGKKSNGFSIPYHNKHLIIV